ncbi:hypothetical protein BCR33DRAFT_784328 [Rhizoclosmatium globosum]|uniref:Uncharacterized protein n=1 Tax=Rhizoclosmatium globosum TaxID=329046 RepID=A0A1Y2CET0_9FUNG|nr:hypothetical protein BCR33DRAFT_784328 [Rhizoclosmatium globosum]|eukprot:ORY45561.1 hypothetical protein BCR33DRAFT_784328 [Rhizoclosmatium globosum]
MAAMDYFEFIATATNNPIRLMEAKKGDQRKSKVIHVVAGDRNAMFYLSYITKLFITWIVYTAAAAFFIKYPYVSKYGFLDFRDIKSVMQHLLYGVQMYCLVEFGMAHFMSYVSTDSYRGSLLECSHVHILSSTLLSSHAEPVHRILLRDFWSNRWNSIIKGSLHRLAFLPTLRLLAASIPQKSKSKKQPEVHYMIAILGHLRCRPRCMKG